MIRRLVDKPGLVFALVFGWKLALLLFTSQPVPSNDSFFYDGPVVNLIQHGAYCNPSLIHALPTSGGKVFCAYPPFYQLGLFCWMSCFGTSALAAMWLHLMLLGGFLLVALAIFRAMQAPAWAGNLAGLYLFGITFHDRPDTLAHLLGALAVLGVIRGGRWTWFGMIALVLAFCTSLQIGGIYAGWCGLTLLAETWRREQKFPFAPVCAAGVALAALVALVRFGYPNVWDGFQEHVRITPAVTRWRIPDLLELMKVARMTPAHFVVLPGIGIVVLKQRQSLTGLARSQPAIVALAGLAAAIAIISACMVRLSATTIYIANYLQPLVVGVYLASEWPALLGVKARRSLVGLLLAASLLTGIRAVGMTTWGVACAADVGRIKATAGIHAKVAALKPGATVIASAPYLYDLAGQTNLHLVHCDWPAPPATSPNWEYDSIGRLRPELLVVTQFDYFRRYDAIIDQLRSHPDLVSLTLTNLATVPAPDRYPALRRLVQHVSWAPVIVEFHWRN